MNPIRPTMKTIALDSRPFIMNTHPLLVSAGVRLRRVLTSVLLLALAFGLGRPAARAADANPPDRMTYQGYLADANGAPLAPTAPVNYDVVFRIYSDQTGGTLIWAEKQTVTVDKGQFSVVLGEGSVNASEPRPALSSVFTGTSASDRFLDLTVTIGTTPLNIAPRLRLVTSPYAFMATGAGKLVGSSGVALVTSSGGAVNVAGPLTATSFSGSGALLTGLTGSQIPSLDGSKITGWVDGPKILGTIRNDSSYSGMIETLYAANDRFGIAFLPTGPTTAIYHSGANSGSSIQLGKMTGASSFSAQMTVAYSGNVGIGVTSPTRGRLEIGGASGAFSLGVYGYGGNTAYTGNVPGGGAPVAVSVYAANEIAASGFIAFSDARIKRTAGRSDGARDLAILTGIEVTDYSYIDTVAKGQGQQKKVIAQQVETVYPQAVSRLTEVVPDIYRQAKVKNGWVTLSTSLKKGERVRLIGDMKEGIHEVLEVTPEKFRTAFAPDSEQVFVYGREVKDFRSVDYDAIAMLNVSATQELARRLAKVEQRESNLSALEEKAARVEKVERELAELKLLVSRLTAQRPVERPAAEAGRASGNPATQQ